MAFRPGDCDISFGNRRIWREAIGLAMVLAGAAAGYGGDRSGRVTGGAVRGSRRGRRASVRRTRRKAAAPQRRDPGLNPGRLRQVTLAVFPSTARLLAPVLAVHGLGRQAWRAGGAPLKLYRNL